MLNAIIRRIKLDKPNTPDEVVIKVIEKVLSQREKEILGLRFPWTQEEVGKKFGVTKERIRAIEAKLFDKIFKEFESVKSWTYERKH